MQVNDLNTLKVLKQSEYWSSLKALFTEIREDFVRDLVRANQSTFERCQGGIMAMDHVLKTLEDIDLLRSVHERSKPENANEHPASDKES